MARGSLTLTDSPLRSNVPSLFLDFSLWICLFSSSAVVSPREAAETARALVQQLIDVLAGTRALFLSSVGINYIRTSSYE